MDTQPSRPASLRPSRRPSRRWFVAAPLFVALLAAGCSDSDDGAASPPRTQTAASNDVTRIVDITSTAVATDELSAPPALVASAGGTAVALGLGTYCWTPPSAGVTSCADPFHIITSNVALRVVRGQAVSVTGALGRARAVSVAARLQPVVEDARYEAGESGLGWAPSAAEPLAVTFDGDSIRFDAEAVPGRYVVRVAIDFAGGDASYGLLLDVAFASDGGPGTPRGGSATQPHPLDEPPALVASAGGTTVPLGLGTVCWMRPDVAVALCSDAVGIITSNVALRVTHGVRVTLTGERGAEGVESVSGTIALLGDGDEPLFDIGGTLAWSRPADADSLDVTIDGGAMHFDNDLAPGRYIVALFAGFPQGDVLYGLLLEVE